MEKKLIANYGSATLSYQTTDTAQFIVESTKNDQSVAFRSKPTEKQIRKAIQGFNK